VLARLLAQNPADNLTPKQVEYANVIHSSGSDLLQLINDILDLSKVEVGKMDMHPERFGLSSLVDDLETIFLPLTAEKGLHFAVTVDGEVPAEIFTDKQRLRQILYNLLSNAVKFTGTGNVEMRISSAPPSPADPADYLEFTVTDTGIGIAEENLTTIFAAFQQGDGTTSRRYGGTGLGLAICREMAAQLGGRITVSSALGAGSTFTLYLPVSWPGAAEAGADHEAAAGQDPAGQAAAVAAASARQRNGAAAGTGGNGSAVTGRVAPAAAHDGLRGRRVLIVDDDPRNVFALTGVLEMYGLTVIHADNGQHGIEALQGGDIDLVLMDVMMPQLDGHATTRAIREMPEFADLPVIAVTARAMQGDKDKSIAAGASDYVTKPVDTEQLLSCMERWLAG
jgi:CheY-like chemotaxis protein